MTQIQPFDPMDPAVQKNVAEIMMKAPVKNLTYKEITTTLRLLYLHQQLRINDYGEVVVRPKDKRLDLLTDDDRFLAMLIDCDVRNVLLGTKRCRRCFGGTVYYWRKIARRCAITDTASALSDDGSGGYYGRGWVIAPHIHTLRKWIVKNIPEFKDLKA